MSRLVVQSKRNGVCGARLGYAACLAAAALVLMPATGRAQAVPTYTISTIAGTGTAGYSGDSGPATSAELDYPSGMVFDSSGNMYFADQVNNRIRKIDTSGNITTVAGNGTGGYLGDGAAATSAELKHPCGVAVDSSGNIYIADTGNNVVRKVSGGNISTIAGTSTAGYSGDTAAATKAELNHPVSVAVDSSGNVYIADTDNEVIREITTDGNINTIVGNGYGDYYGDNITALASSLNHPLGIVLDGNGNLFIADQLNNRIRMVNLTTKNITTVAGNGVPGYAGNGSPATNAELEDPSWVAVDSSGSLFITDLVNNVVRRVGTDGNISTIAGNGKFGTYGDGGPALQAAITCPLAVAVNAAGKVYVAQGENNIIRLLTPPAASGSGAHHRDRPSIDVLPRPNRSLIHTGVEGEVREYGIKGY